MNKSKFLFGIILTALVWSCTKDFVVKDIKDASVTILAPSNNMTTANNAITFWWEELDGAEKYNVQIVKPNFSAIQELIVDTNVTGDKFKYTLTPGTYQWRIKAKNAGGSTQYSTFNLVIDTTSNLSGQLVIPIAPVNNYLTGSKTVAFSWSSLAAADNYEIQVLNSSSTVVDYTTTTNTTYTFTLSTGGVYTWKVRALNAFSISQYNTPLTFTVDLTAPTVSVLYSPTHASQVKDTVSLKWTRSGTDTWYDSVYVSIDSAFASVVSSSKVYASKIKINALNQTIPVSATYYWWRVKSVDSVGNRSGYSNQLKFKLIP
jgi:predicted secreted protein